MEKKLQSHSHLTTCSGGEMRSPTKKKGEKRSRLEEGDNEKHAWDFWGRDLSKERCTSAWYIEFSVLTENVALFKFQLNWVRYHLQDDLLQKFISKGLWTYCCSRRSRCLRNREDFDLYLMFSVSHLHYRKSLEIGENKKWGGSLLLENDHNYRGKCWILKSVVWLGFGTTCSKL